MAIPDRVIFDAEPLVADADGEPGSETVEGYLDAVAVGDARGRVNHVNLTEVRYTLARKYSRDVADDYLEWLLAIGVTPVDVARTWVEAADFVLEYNPALGDAFALATAKRFDGTLLVGADDDYDGVGGVPIERFRPDPA